MMTSADAGTTAANAGSATMMVSAAVGAAAAHAETAAADAGPAMIMASVNAGSATAEAGAAQGDSGAETTDAGTGVASPPASSAPPWTAASEPRTGAAPAFPPDGANDLGGPMRNTSSFALDTASPRAAAVRPGKRRRYPRLTAAIMPASIGLCLAVELGGRKMNST